jgi:hypothetical protein
MRGHRLDAERVHQPDHVAAVGPQCGERALPGVAAVQKQRIGTVSADRLYDRGDPVKAADLAVGLRQGREIVIGQRIVERRAVLYPVHPAEVRAGHMRRLAGDRANADVPLGLAEPDRLQLRVDVGEMDERDIARGVESQKVVLRQRLLGGKTGPVSGSRGPENGRRRHADLKKITARDHGPSFRRQSHSEIRMRQVRKKARVASAARAGYQFLTAGPSTDNPFPRDAR